MQARVEQPARDVLGVPGTAGAWPACMQRGGLRKQGAGHAATEGRAPAKVGKERREHVCADDRCDAREEEGARLRCGSGRRLQQRHVRRRQRGAGAGVSCSGGRRGRRWQAWWSKAGVGR